MNIYAKKWILPLAILLGCVVIFFLMNFYSFLIFHTLIEVFSATVMFSIFTFFWLTRDRIENNFYLILGSGFLFIGIIDLIHTLSYKGMNIFEGYDANLPTQLWIAGRYLQLLTILLAIFTIKKKIHLKYVIFGYFVVTSVILITLFVFPVFPDCFIEGQGLTPFKKMSEYIFNIHFTINIQFTIAIFLVHKQKDIFPDRVRHNLYAAFIATALAELLFTFYVSVFGISNVMGHIFKILAAIFVFRAILEVGLREPFEIVFRELKQRETELQEKISQIKTLSGMLPICASCKKVRDDTGYWHMVEEYIQEHTEAEFTHSICPECTKKFYPEFV